MYKVLILGSLGYLGSRLSEYLVEKGCKVKGIDVGLFQYGVVRYPKNCETIQKSADAIHLSDVKGYDVVIQLAGISNDPFGNFNPTKIYDPTRIYARKIAEYCKNAGVRYIFPSSCSVYGKSDNPLTEDSKVAPKTDYSQNKIDVEKDLEELADENFSPISLRLATVFGPSPRIRFDVVINMLVGMAFTEKKIILNSNGQAWRPHVHIEDVCNAFYQCIKLKYSENTLLTLNVGRNDNNMKIIDVAKLISEEISGCQLLFLSDKELENELIEDKKILDGVDVRNYRVSFDKINYTVPEFKCEYTVKNGIVNLIEFFREINLNSKKFAQTDFYRLQQIEYLIKTEQTNMWQDI